MTDETSMVLFDPARHNHLLPQFVAIHRACVEHDHQNLTFIRVGDDQEPKLRRYWEGHFDGVKSGEKLIILCTTQSETVLKGFVILHMPFSETGPFRAHVGCLMVSAQHRRQGIARQLMLELEHLARERNRGLLMLDTTIGSNAEQGRVYPKLGYIEYGRIPHYGIHPRDGHLVDEVFFYKDLRSQTTV